MAIQMARRAAVTSNFDFIRGFSVRAPLLILIAAALAFAILTAFHASIETRTALRLSSVVAVLARRAHQRIGGPVSNVHS